MMAARDRREHRGQQQHPSPAAAAADGGSPRWGSDPQRRPTRTKSFFLQSQAGVARRLLVPPLCLLLAALYLHGLLARNVGSGVDVLRDAVGGNVTRASALAPRSLADVALANAEVSWRRRLDREAAIREEKKVLEARRREMEESARLAKSREESETNGTATDARAEEPGENANANATEQFLLLLPRTGNFSGASEEYGKRIAGLRARRSPKGVGAAAMRNFGQHGAPSSQRDLGLLPVLIMISMCTVFRVLVSLAIGHAADDAALDDEGDGGNDAGGDVPAGRRRGGLSFTSGLGLGTGGREAALRRRRARARRQFERFVDRLNAERTANGERPIAADTLRHLVNGRDFNGDDYDELSSFVEENGPAAGSIFSIIGATEAEIGRCPTRTLGEDDELLSSREGGRPAPTCPICLEPYQAGETVRTIPCFHAFHTGCIDPWLAQRAECPVCKHSAIG